jgi:hypothetical protein
MEKEFRPKLSQERGDKISGVSVEPEKRYGIYLPDWKSVSRSLRAFASSDFQSAAPITKEESEYKYELMIRSKNQRQEFGEYSETDLLDFKNFYTEATKSKNLNEMLSKMKVHFDRGEKIQFIDKNYDSGSWEAYDGDGRSYPGGRAFYKTDVTIEALRWEKKDTDNPEADVRSYKKPYLLNIYSRLNGEDPQAKLLGILGAEQAILPRRVEVGFVPKGYTSHIDLDGVVDRLNTALHADDEHKISVSDVTSALIENKGRNTLIGEYDGLALEVRTYNARSEPTERENDLLEHMHSAFGPVGLEFTIADSTLETRVYGKSRIIPPEKRQAAQALTEKIRKAFSPNT